MGRTLFKQYVTGQYQHWASTSSSAWLLLSNASGNTTSAWLVLIQSATSQATVDALHRSSTASSSGSLQDGLRTLLAPSQP